MKKTLCYLLIFSLLITCISSLVITAGADNAPTNARGTHGLVFEAGTPLTVSGDIIAQPNTVSATVYLKASDFETNGTYDESFRPGVVISNWRGTPDGYAMEIHAKGGRPRLYIRSDVDHSTKTVDLQFATKLYEILKGTDTAAANAGTPIDTPLNISIVIDPASRTGGANSVAKLYVYDMNGKLLKTESKTVKRPLPTTEEYAPEKLQYLIGGDYSSGNKNYFRGEILSVAMYTSHRTEEQCKTVTDTADKGMICGFDLTKSAPEYGRDLSGNKHHIVGTVVEEGGNDDTPVVDGFFISKNPNPPTDYAYSMVVVPDTQFLTEKDAKEGTSYLNNVYDWIVENKDEKKIELVMGLGDITDDDTEAEWLHAQTQISKLNGVVPYTLVKGGSPHDRIATFNTYFGTDTYYGQNEVDGVYDATKTENAYKLVTAGDVDYLILMLDFGPIDEVLLWAGNVISQHPDRQVIITTHCYLYNESETKARLQTETDPASPRSTTATGGTLKKNNGDDIWNELVKLYPNIVMVLSGHYSNNNILTLQSEGVHGNTVTQMLIDSQDYDSKNGCETGFVAVLYFSEDGKQISVEYISTVREKQGKPAYFKTNNQFNVNLFAEVEAPAVPNPDDFNTPYGVIPEKYDVETYPFATFVPDATSETGYKFLKVTKALLCTESVTASGTALHSIRTDQTGAIPGAVIYMRRDVVYESETSYSNHSYAVDTFTIDLGGHIFYDNHGYATGLFNWVFKDNTRYGQMNNFVFTIQNGDFVLNSQPLFSYQFSGDNMLDNTITTIFKNIDISFASGATATSVFGPMFTNSKYVTGTGTYKNFHSFNISMINCTVDYENAPAGVDLLADGSSPRSNLFTSGCTFKNRDNVPPKMNITMSNDFILNAYIPLVTTDEKDTVNGIKLGGVIYSLDGAPVVDIDGARFYKVSMAITPETFGTLLSLSVDVDHLYTFSDGSTATKSINSSFTVDIIAYLEGMAKDSDVNVANLGNDILAYIKSVYVYAGGDNAVVDRITAIIGAGYETDNAPALPEAKKETAGMASASLLLGETPAFIFYPEVDSEGNPTYALEDYQFALDGKYRLHREVKTDENGKQYFSVSTYAYAMGGTVEYLVKGTDIHGYYNISAYLEYANTTGNAKLVAMVERLYKYAESAKAYRESR